MRRGAVAAASPFMFKEAFAVLGLEPNFELNEKVLEAHYLKRQSAIHPDRFVDGLPAERDFAETKTAQLNQAYGLLKNPVTRAQCLLELRGRQSDVPASPELLAEMMHWREELATIETPQALKDLDKKVVAELRKTCRHFGAAFAQDFPQALAIFQRLRYLDKLAEEIKGLQARSSVRSF